MVVPIALARRGIVKYRPLFWTPSSLGSALADWWDPTKNVVLSGSNVTSWTGVNGNVLSQSTSSLQPTYSTTTKQLNFQSQQLATTSFPNIFFSGFEAACAIEIVYTYDYQALLSPVGSDFSLAMNNGDLGVFQCGHTDLEGSSTLNYQVLSIADWFSAVGCTGGSITFNTDVDGTDNASTMTLGQFPNPNPTCTGFMIGSGWQSIPMRNCYIGDLVLCNRILTTSEHNKLIGFLAWKNGTQGQLPASHPYKSRAPYVSDP